MSSTASFGGKKKIVSITLFLILPHCAVTGEDMPEYEIPQDAPHVVFSSPVTHDTANKLINAVLGAREQHPGKDIVILIDSMGGGVEPAMSAYHLIRNVSATVWTINTGRVESIANIIYLAGDKRLCQPGTTFGFHGTNWPSPSSSLVQDQALEVLRNLKHDRSRIIDIYVDRTDLSKGSAGKLFGHMMERKDCAWAESNGFSMGTASHPLIPGNMPDKINVYWVH